jgi:shikimate kinase
VSSEPPPDPLDLRIAVVGPCSSGKSSLTAALRAQGYTVRQPAQEHSYVPTMWRRFAQPDILIYLDVDHETALQRRPHTTGPPERLVTQRRRLAHARQHCDFYLDTSQMSFQQVRDHVLAFLETLQ